MKWFRFTQPSASAPSWVNLDTVAVIHTNPDGTMRLLYHASPGSPDGAAWADIESPNEAAELRAYLTGKQRCPRCGKPTMEPRAAEAFRICGACDTETTQAMHEGMESHLD